MRIQFHFDGVPDGLTEDSDAYADAIAEAWANVSAEDISNAATLTETEED